MRSDSYLGNVEVEKRATTWSVLRVATVLTSLYFQGTRELSPWLYVCHPGKKTVIRSSWVPIKMIPDSSAERLKVYPCLGAEEGIPREYPE